MVLPESVEGHFRLGVVRIITLGDSAEACNTLALEFGGREDIGSPVNYSITQMQQPTALLVLRVSLDRSRSQRVIRN